MHAFSVILGFHIAGGTLGLLCGSLILITKKGTRQHILIGTVYYWGMLAASLSAFILSVMHPNYFLFIVGVFSAYLVITGLQYIRLKHPVVNKRIRWVVSSCMLVFAILFIGLGILLFVKKDTFGFVPLVFGSISILMVYQDYRNYTGRAAIGNFWLTTHLQRMIGGYIASATAFLVVNNTLLPGIIAWLLPTIILTPLILRWTAKYRSENSLKQL